MLLRDVEVDGQRVDVRFGAYIDSMGPSLSPTVGEEVLDGAGGALIPGLHDHHLHLLALAAAADSISAPDSAGLAYALRSTSSADPLRSTSSADPLQWMRIIGFAGDDALNRAALDALEPRRPVRVQHRSGALWVLNSPALAAVGMSDHPDGRLWREDHSLGERLRAIDAAMAPDLGVVGRMLAGYGITGVTDATPDLDPDARHLLAVAQETGELPQTVHLLAPGKLVLADHELPDLDELTATIARLHVGGQPVALHVVTRETLGLAIAALTEAGSMPGDRIEHGALIDPGSIGTLRELGIAVVTQPGFIADRGDDYLRDIPAGDQCDLYRYDSLAAGRVPVAPSSDAPFGPLDPWLVMRAAHDRASGSGARVNEQEAVSVSQALSGYLLPLDDLRARPREVMVGAPADLVLLEGRLDEVMAQPDADRVRVTWCRGAR